MPRASSWRGIEQFGADLRKYLLVRAQLGVFAAILGAILLWVLNVPFPLLWAFLVFAASFIPNIGTFIAVIPPTILALLGGGVVPAVAVVVGYTLINFAQDHFLQPVVMGSELNLTPLVVFLWVFAWAWILGPAEGALLAVPLTVGLVAIFEAYPSGARIAAALLRNRLDERPGAAGPGPGSSLGGRRGPPKPWRRAWTVAPTADDDGALSVVTRAPPRRRTRPRARSAAGRRPRAPSRRCLRPHTRRRAGRGRAPVRWAAPTAELNEEAGASRAISAATWRSASVRASRWGAVRSGSRRSTISASSSGSPIVNRRKASSARGMHHQNPSSWTAGDPAAL